MPFLRQSFLLVLLACYLTNVKASTIHRLHNPHTIPASGVADVVLLIIFAALAFLQLICIAVPELFRMQNGDSFTNVAGAGSRSMCRYKLSFTIVMIFALSSFMASYSLRVAHITDTLNSIRANIFTTEIAKESLYAALLVLLAACAMASEAWHGRGNIDSIRKSRVFNLSLVIALLALMVVLTFVCTLVVAISKNPKILPLVWFFFHQAHVLLYIILSVYYTVPAVSLWRMKEDPRFEQLYLSDAGGAAFIPIDVLRRIVKQISPLLCIAAAYEFISDIVGSLPVGSNSSVPGSVDIVIEGVIYFCLSHAALCAAFRTRRVCTPLFSTGSPAV